jgi:ketosteroid isomerase-like protein
VSQENVEVVREAIAAFSRRDLDGATRDTHPDVEVDWSRSRGLEAGIYSGRAATRRFWSTFYEAFDRIVVVPTEFIEHEDCVIVVDRTHMWGRDGIEVEAQNVGVVTLRDGQILRWRLCRDRTEALEAVGLEE